MAVSKARHCQGFGGKSIIYLYRTFLVNIQYLRVQDQSKKYDSKKNVWVSDPEEGYIAAEIKSAKGDMVTVVTAKGDEVG